MKIPTLIHEQNVIPGLANRFLSQFSTKIAIGFRESSRYFKSGKVIFTGNPIRKDLKKIHKTEARKFLGLNELKFTILVFGGSQGSCFINQSFVQALKFLSTKHKDVLQIIHITGDSDKLKMESEYEKINIAAKLFPYIFDMSYAYSAADLVVCRSGAITISEINYFGRAAILIPYPYARGHQILNAEFMQQRQAAFIVAQDDDCVTKLHELISNLMEDSTLLENMSKKSYGLTEYNASTKLAELIKKLTVKKSG